MLAASLAAVLLLGGCGDDTATDPSASDGSDTSDSPSASVDTSDPPEPTPSESQIDPSQATDSPEALPDWPACGEVWVEGTRLPADYKGCLDGETAVKAKNQYCEFGKKLVTYTDQFWAVRGGKVNDAKGPLSLIHI